MGPNSPAARGPASPQSRQRAEQQAPRRSASRVSWFDERLGESLEWSRHTKNTFIEFEERSDEERVNVRRQRSAPAQVMKRRLSGTVDEAASNIVYWAAVAALNWASRRPSKRRSRGRSNTRSCGSRGSSSTGSCSGRSGRSLGRNTPRRRPRRLAKFRRRPSGSEESDGTRGTPARVEAQPLRRSASQELHSDATPRGGGLPVTASSASSSAWDPAAAAAAAAPAATDGAAMLQEASPLLAAPVRTRSPTSPRSPASPAAARPPAAAGRGAPASKPAVAGRPPLLGRTKAPPGGSHFKVPLANRFMCLEQGEAPSPDEDSDQSSGGESQDLPAPPTSPLAAASPTRGGRTPEPSGAATRSGKRKKRQQRAQPCRPDTRSERRCLPAAAAEGADGTRGGAAPEREAGSAAAGLAARAAAASPAASPAASGSAAAACSRALTREDRWKILERMHEEKRQGSGSVPGRAAAAPAEPQVAAAAAASGAVRERVASAPVESVDAAAVEPAGPKLEGSLAEGLALFTAKLNEAAIAAHLRASGSRRVLLATPIDPCDTVCKDVLAMQMGGVVLCEAADADGWCFGTAIAPKSIAGTRGCFRREGMRPVTAELQRFPQGERVELAPAHWEEVDRIRGSSTQDRLRQKALLNRMRAARDAWNAQLRSS